MKSRNIIISFIIIWILLQIITIGIFTYLNYDSIPYLLGLINLTPRAYMLVEISLILALLLFLPGYILQKITHTPKDWISCMIMGLTFDLILGIILTSYGGLKFVILAPVYLTITILSILIFYNEYGFKQLRLWVKSHFQLEYLFFFFIFFIFLFYPRWFWSKTVLSPWPGDPIDRLARAQLLVEGWDIWTDIIPGEITWYPPLWNILMAFTHKLSGLWLYSVTSGSMLLFGIIVFLLIFQLGKNIFGSWGGNLLCLLTLLFHFMVFSAFQGAATPHGFSYIPFLSTVYFLYNVRENRYYAILAGLGACLALMTYPQTGYITFAYFVLYYLFVLDWEDKKNLKYDFGMSLIICIILASIYWVPFTWRYGIIPPEDSWLRNIYKTAIGIHSWNEFYIHLLKPYFLDYIIVLTALLCLKKKSKSGWRYIILFILTLYLGQWALRWHHIVTDPLFGFSIQPDRFERFYGFSRGLLFTWGFFYILKYVSELNQSLLDSLFGFRYYRPYLSQISCLILFIFMIFIYPFNEYYKFLDRLIHPEKVNYKNITDIPMNLPTWKFLEEDSLLELKVHPHPFPHEIWLGLWFQEKTPKESVILAPIWESWYNVAGFGGRRVFVNMISYHGPMDTSQPRHEEIMKEIYRTQDINRAEKLIEENQIDYICKFGYTFEGQSYGTIFDSINLIPVFALDTIVTVYKYQPKREAPHPDVVIFGDSAQRVSPWIHQLEKENYFVEFAPYTPWQTESINTYLERADHLLLIDSRNFTVSFDIDQLVSNVKSGKTLILVGNSAFGFYEKYGDKIQTLMGCQSIHELNIDKPLIKAIYRNHHSITQDLPGFAEALIVPWNNPIYTIPNSQNENVLGWLPNENNQNLFVEYKLGKGKVIFWGINFHQMAQLQQVTLIHRLAEYLKSPEKKWLPLPMIIKIDNPPEYDSNKSNDESISLQAIHNKQDKYIGTYRDERDK